MTKTFTQFGVLRPNQGHKTLRHVDRRRQESEAHLATGGQPTLIPDLPEICLQLQDS